MSKINEIMGAVGRHGDDCIRDADAASESFEGLRELIAAALADARPAPAQAVPDADGARFRWLCEDHSDRETRERCRSLIDRLPVMSYSDAVVSIDAAMAAAPEHKA